MKLPEIGTPVRADASEWERRKRNNVRLGWIFAGLAFVLFLVAIWKYRPL